MGKKKNTELKIANIILVGQPKLIDLFTEEWFRKSGIKTEDIISLFSAPGFVAFESKSFKLIATPQNITVNILAQEITDNILAMLKRYIDKVSSESSLMFNALGFNFVWKSNTPRKIQIIADKINLNEIFKYPNKIQFGAIFYENYKNCRMRLSKEIKVNSSNKAEEHLFNFNFHYPLPKDVKETKKAIKKYLGEYQEKIQYAETLVNKLSY